MSQDFNDLIYTRVEYLSNSTEISSDSFEEVLKKLTTEDLSIIENYGCYCNFNNDRDFRVKSKGKPIDTIDHFCKVLHEGYTCAIIDSEIDKGYGDEADDELETSSSRPDLLDEMSDSETKAEPEDLDYHDKDMCVPWEVQYKSAFNNGMFTNLTLTEIRYQCEKYNGKETCSALACQVEGWFVQSFFNYFTAKNGGEVDQDLRHTNGFKYKDTCFGRQLKIEQQSCCNEYPVRYPFNNKGGERKCCRSHTYNARSHTCCADGTTTRNECEA